MRKKIANIMFLICVVFTLFGCGKTDDSEKNGGSNNNVGSIETTDTASTNDVMQTEQKYMVMLEDKLYVDTGETNSQARCGNMDFSLEYTGSRDIIPSQNGQVNCDVEGGQYSWRENRIEICVDDSWHILAYKENNLDGVSMRVTEVTDALVTVEITNETDADIQCGEDYLLEKKDEESGEWCMMQTVIEDYAFGDIAYQIQKGTPSSLNIEVELLYGHLEPGTYRIVKKITDFKGTGDNINYWYSAEFTVDK